MPLRINLRHQLLGLASCARVLKAGISTQPFGDCVAARVEVEGELTRIESTLGAAWSNLLDTLGE
jgi:hypothetical protein